MELLLEMESDEGENVLLAIGLVALKLRELGSYLPVELEEETFLKGLRGSSNREGLAAYGDRDGFISVGGSGGVVRMEKLACRHEGDGDQTRPKDEGPVVPHMA